MKIGTDGVLLGAWAPVRDAKKILDIGTGCGIVALMLAQRSASHESQISAIDIEIGAATDAVQNFSASPWPTRLPRQMEEVHLSLNQFVSRAADSSPGFDLTVCNPPYFVPGDQHSDSSRETARTLASLSRNDLFHDTKSILSDSGRFCLVLPFDQAESTIRLARSVGFYLCKRTNVRSTPTAKPKRVLLEFGLRPVDESQVESTELVVEKTRHQYTEGYALLTRDFHLRYSNESNDGLT